MHLPTLLTLLPTLAHAGCYKGGITTWGPDQQRARDIASSICNAAFVSGTFASMQTKYHCGALDGPNKKVEFEVQWKGHGTLTLNDADCSLRLVNEINGCEFGGESTVYDWYFR
ncbi:hypothetical protein BDV96DRAFT_284451 [Lophiotrema nucula]|uniref:Uncharacterized protein n=1 Tax=Lophiotrema nucula TaxID=690887 RepID=A0A6A5YM30_9PLEO|nr:hypothetical protein BDV96DRAFT_284451 [Lophiotrema nucula]